MYPELCKAIICYPLRLNTKESLDRLYHKYVKKNGWKFISENYDPNDYFFEINDKRLNELFNKNGEEEKNIIDCHYLDVISAIIKNCLLQSTSSISFNVLTL
jgi:hypothetical protein